MSRNHTFQGKHPKPNSDEEKTVLGQRNPEFLPNQNAILELWSEERIREIILQSSSPHLLLLFLHPWTLIGARMLYVGTSPDL